MTDCKAKMTVEELIQFYEDSQKGSDVRIVIAQRGWVFVGRYVAAADEVVLYDAKCIRKWGTSRGLGELTSGPLSNTELDDHGTVRMHPLAVLATIDCDADKWAGSL